MASSSIASSSFSTRRINSSTWLVVEDDEYEERPFIYVKIHDRAPVILLSDTGSDAPAAPKKDGFHAKSGSASKSDKIAARFIHLRDYLENCPIEANDNKPLNPSGSRQYVVICTHCHYDHIGGIAQFHAGGSTAIIASAAGKEFIESNLEEHGQFKFVHKPVPRFVITAWAQAFDRLYYNAQERKIELSRYIAANHADETLIDLGITIIQTPGHTPDELAWFDHDELHLYVGDSLYEKGAGGTPIEWPTEGDLVEWAFSMEKLRMMVRSENKRALKGNEGSEDAEGWVQLVRRVKLGAGHETHSADAEEILKSVRRFWRRTLSGKVAVSNKRFTLGEWYYTWEENRGRGKLALQAPARLMDDARRFYGKSALDDEMVE